MNWKNWIKKAGVRAIKTVAEAALGVIGASKLFGDVDWSVVISASLLAAIISLLISTAGLPELTEEDDAKHAKHFEEDER